MNLTIEEKKKFLIMKGWETNKGFVFPTPPAEDESDYTFVSSEDVLTALKKGEQEYFNSDKRDWQLYDLDEAFDYEIEDYIDDLQLEYISDEDLWEKIRKELKQLKGEQND